MGLVHAPGASTSADYKGSVGSSVREREREREKERCLENEFCSAAKAGDKVLDEDEDKIVRYWNRLEWVRSCR